jgi:SAM-dependent methyltransferase
MPFEELKERHAVVWGSGPYQGITETVADLHQAVLQRVDPQPGERVLDLACGTGAVPELVAAKGIEVVGIDLAPALIEQAKERAAAERGLDIDYRVGDVEALDLEDASFDVVTSTCGLMFAPDHAAVAKELVRVTKPGGRIGMACWTLDSGLAKIFGIMRQYQPAPPAGVGNPFDWGREDHVRDLLGGDFNLEFEILDSPLEMESGEAVWELFVSDYGPTKVLAESLDDEKREDLHREFVELHEQSRTNGGVKASRTYLLTVGTRK